MKTASETDRAASNRNAEIILGSLVVQKTFIVRGTILFVFQSKKYKNFGFEEFIKILKFLYKTVAKNIHFIHKLNVKYTCNKKLHYTKKQMSTGIKIKKRWNIRSRFVKPK